MKIIGITVGTTIPKPNFNQTDPTKGDYIKGDIVAAIPTDTTLTQEGHIADAKAVGDALSSVLEGTVSYDEAQNLTEEQKIQARENISAATMIDKGLIIQSSTPGSTKYFKLTIDDDGVMTASEIV